MTRSPQASQLWPLAVLLGEIATRVERERILNETVDDTAAHSAQGAG